MSTEAILPVEIEIPLFRTLIEAQWEEVEWIKQRHGQLSLMMKDA